MKMNVDALAAMPVHDAAQLFPMMDLMDGKEVGALARLAADMRDNGCHTPVVLYKGNVLDGRNRIAAAREIGIDFLPTTEYEGDDPLMYVLSLNLHRRHLTIDQLIELGAKLREPLADRQGERTDLAPEDAKSGKTAAIVADALGGAVSERTLERGWALQERAPELWKDVQRKAESVTGAYNKMVGPTQKPAATNAELVLAKMENAYLRFVDCLDELIEAKANDEQWGVAIQRAKSLLTSAESKAGHRK